MDRDILGLDPLSSKGWQSMGVLHYLGLKKDFKGIFKNSDLNEAIEYLKSDEQDFSFIIELLENTSANYGEIIVQSLYEVGMSQDKDFENSPLHYAIVNDNREALNFFLSNCPMVQLCPINCFDGSLGRDHLLEFFLLEALHSSLWARCWKAHPLPCMRNLVSV